MSPADNATASASCSSTTSTRATKRFHLGREGVTRALDDARAEAQKCMLLCANCHVEVELGYRALPVTSDAATLSGVAQRDGPG